MFVKIKYFNYNFNYNCEVKNYKYLYLIYVIEVLSSFYRFIDKIVSTYFNMKEFRLYF